jgi:hypothetical protein
MSFLLAAMLLFVSHLTFQFYQNSNLPSAPTASPRVWISSWTKAGVKLLHHRDAACLRFDRRYDFASVFGLLSPEFRINYHRTVVGIRPKAVQSGWSLPPITAIFLRGPPTPQLT